MPQQFELDFEPGLLDRYPEFLDCVRASVYGCRKPFKAVAADLDLSASDLSQKLSESSGNNFPLRRLPELIRATGNLEPIYWLVESYCEDPDTKMRRDVATIADLLPKLAAIVKAHS